MPVPRGLVPYNEEVLLPVPRGLVPYDEEGIGTLPSRDDNLSTLKKV